MEKPIEILAEPLATFERIYAEQLSTSVSLIDDINKQVTQQKGKQLRPMLTMLSAGACLGEITERKIYLAVALEMLHNSSLIHDDVVDESAIRRGMPTTNSRWGNKIAVLFGDFYLSKVMYLLCQYATHEEMAIVNNTAIEMSEGELLQQQNSLTTDLRRQSYFSTIYKKTASLLSTCCRVGQWSEKGNAVDLKDFGMHFGMAFQMRDDLLDYLPTSITGKPQGNDILERKMTLPLIYFMDRADEVNRKATMDLIDRKDIDDILLMQILTQVERSGALQATAADIDKEIDLALESLSPLEASPYKEGLVSLTESLRPSVLLGKNIK